MTYILGIDPGIEGAWAVLDSFGQLVSSGDLPVVGEGKKRMVSAPLLAGVLDVHPISEAFVERVGAMPGQGVSSMFRFGQAIGTINGVLGARHVPVSYVPAAVWKRHFKLPGEKEPSRLLAIETWPDKALIHFNRKKDHGRAEAALIALWGARSNVISGAAA